MGGARLTQAKDESLAGKAKERLEIYSKSIHIIVGALWFLTREAQSGDDHDRARLGILRFHARPHQRN